MPALRSEMPWESIDIEHLLSSLPLNSPVPQTPGRLGQQLALAAGAGGLSGGLSAKEQAMTVEEWIKWRAAEGERVLRRRCEGLVEAFEREGMRGVEVLGGVGVV
jgi:hypothetical protein